MFPRLVRDAAVTGPVSPAPARPTSEPRPAPRPADCASKEADALRDRFQQAVARRGTSLADEVEALTGKDNDQAAMAGEMSLPAKAPSGKDDQGTASRIPEAYATQANTPQQATGLVSSGGEAAGRAGYAMDAAVLAQFAERMALPTSQSGRTTMTLDPTQYRVAEVRIEGAAAEGLSITLKSHSDTKGSDHEAQECQPLEALRSRLLARAIPVALLDQT